MESVVNLKGMTGLVMHNIRLADKTDRITKAIREITDKKVKTDADEAEIARLEWYGGLYHDKDTGIYVPAWNIIRCFERAAAAMRQGASLLRAVAVTTDRVPIAYKGPKDLADLWDHEEYRFRKMVVVQRNTVSRMRPIFRTWSLTLALELDIEEMNPEAFRTIAERAGRTVGLGDARKLGYGRFEAEVLYDDNRG